MYCSIQAEFATPLYNLEKLSTITFSLQGKHYIAYPPLFQLKLVLVPGKPLNLDREDLIIKKYKANVGNLLNYNAIESRLCSSREPAELRASGKDGIPMPLCGPETFEPAEEIQAEGEEMLKLLGRVMWRVRYFFAMDVLGYYETSTPPLKQVHV
jgi:hypothetical protein